MSQKEGKRVADVKVRCSECRVPKYEPLDKEEIYKVKISRNLSSFLNMNVVTADKEICVGKIVFINAKFWKKLKMFSQSNFLKKV